jgi:hypothetical protein
VYTHSMMDQFKIYQVTLIVQMTISGHGLKNLLDQIFRSPNTQYYPILQYIKVKVKESRNRPSVAQRVPGGLGSQIQ